MVLAEHPTGGDGGWRRLRWLLLGLVLCRGVVYLCVLPPFEGWDEYQHVGYVMHVSETGRRPVLGEADLPAALLAALPEFPQSRYALHLIGRCGAEGYATYWTRWDRRGSGPPASPRPGGEGPGLYVAQHGSLYYRLAAPIFRAAGGVGDLRRSVGTLRLVNLLLIVAAAGIALNTIGRLLRDVRDAPVIGLLIATQPLFLINGVRVASDALGVLLATAAIAWGLTLDDRRLLLRSAGLGLVTGLAVLAKAVNFGLVPFVAFCWLITVVRNRVSSGRSASAAGLIVLGCLAVVGAELHANYTRFGVATPMVEAVRNQQAGHSASDVLRTARAIAWRGKLEAFWLADNLLKGGWSFVDPRPKLVRRYHDLALACLLGWACLALRRTRPQPPVFRSPRGPAACLVLCAGFTAALAYHMVQSKLAFGVTSTNSWYAAATLPWFLVLVGGGGLTWPLGRFRPILPALLAVTFLTTEAIVIWGRMIPTYSGGAGGWEALRRLSYLQPVPFGTPTLLVATAAELILFAFAVVTGCRPLVQGTILQSRPRLAGSVPPIHSNPRQDAPPSRTLEPEIGRQGTE